MTQRASPHKEMQLSKSAQAPGTAACAADLQRSRTSGYKRADGRCASESLSRPRERTIRRHRHTATQLSAGDMFPAQYARGDLRDRRCAGLRAQSRQAR